MPQEKLNLSSEFEKICIGPLRKEADASPSSTSKIQSPSSADSIANQITHQPFKVRRRQLIKPSRLKFIYKTQSEALKEGNTAAPVEEKIVAEADYSTEAFQLLRDLRISPSDMAAESSSPTSAAVLSTPSQVAASASSSSLTTLSAATEDDRKLKPSCSAQYSNKLQQQLSTSSSEFDSTIDVMSDYFSYHLNLHKDKNFSNVMYL